MRVLGLSMHSESFYTRFYLQSLSFPESSSDAWTCLDLQFTATHADEMCSLPTFLRKLPKSTPTKPVRHVFPRLKTGVISAVAETLRSRGLQWSPTRSPVHTWHLLGTKISGCTTRHEACRSRRHDHAPVAIAPSTVRL